MSMNPALQRRRGYNGPAVFSYGFRPFFLAAGLWAVSLTTPRSATRPGGTWPRCVVAR